MDLREMELPKLYSLRDALAERIASAYVDGVEVDPALAGLYRDVRSQIATQVAEVREWADAPVGAIAKAFGLPVGAVDPRGVQS